MVKYRIIRVNQGSVVVIINGDSYESIRKWKEENINLHLVDIFTLNKFHDAVMKMVYELAIIRLNKGTPPCDFCWFVTGSGGRFEQGYISDQDHGMVYLGSEKEFGDYFLDLGKEISFGLDQVGYPYCQGNIMSSNPLWCKSLDAWKKQLFDWMEDRSLESIRNLQIFMDARCLIGLDTPIKQLKSFIFAYQKTNTVLLKRLMESVMHVKSALGPLGQLIVEEHGIHQGSIDYKYGAYIPYVNAVRILSIKEELYGTSTLERLSELGENIYFPEEFLKCQEHFRTLLEYRLLLAKGNTYDDTHFIKVKNLTSEEKRNLKRILKDGKKLHHYVSKMIEKG